MLRYRYCILVVTVFGCFFTVPDADFLRIWIRRPAPKDQDPKHCSIGTVTDPDPDPDADPKLKVN